VRVAITGAAGFIGRRLVGKLLAKRDEVIALGRRNLPDEMDIDRRLSCLEVDLRDHDPVDLSAKLAGVDSIVHLAAYIPRDLSDAAEADHCLQINASGTLRMLLAAEQAGVRRFIYASAGQFYNCSESAATEDDVVYPSSRATFYLVSKLVGEIYVDYFGRLKKVETVNLRIGSVYGPDMPSTSTMHRLILNVMTGRPIQIENHGSYRVDLVYVDDVASIICRVLRSGVTGVYNVGSGKATTMAELIEEIVRQCPGSSPILDHISTSKSLGFSALDITKARRDLGFKPLDLKEGLARTIASVRESGVILQHPCRGKSLHG
jgi:UDP-glucose 4-epimerase